MIELLRVLGRAICGNCGEDITHYSGDLSGTQWTHDKSGKRECPGSLYATPTTGTR